MPFPHLLPPSLVPTPEIEFVFYSLLLFSNLGKEKKKTIFHIATQ
jgi:hypothetical protein